MLFDKLGLDEPLGRAVKEQGYTEPTPIQAATIPTVLEGKDLMASAQTGTGKTAAFVLPILQQLIGTRPVKGGHAKVLVLTPTRELAAQVHASVETYSRHVSISSTVVFGGVNISPQIRKLRQGVDILVATPGRLLDLYQQKAIRFSEIEIFVLDEADRMLDMGFLPDIRRIRSQLPDDKQTLLFSATFSDEIRTLAKTMLHRPVEIDVAPRNSAVETIVQHIHPVDKNQKSKLLAHLIDQEQWGQVLVFARTKHGSDRLVKELGKAGIRSVAIHGNKSQSQRTRALADFKRGKVDVMVATDIAARGIDIQDLPHVVNFDLPHVSEDYVHRIGRTGRAGKQGQAISLVCADEIKQLRQIEQMTKKKLERIEVEGFEPTHQLPESHSVRQAPKRPTGGRGNNVAKGDRPARRRRRNRPRYARNTA